jgi:hypothetical protein
VSTIPDELVTFVQVLVEDDDLRAWFESFDDTPDGRIKVEFRGLATRMRAAGEAPELIAATALLSNPTVYWAARAALREALGSAR